MESVGEVKLPAACCGCGACLTACPKGAITMKADMDGCLHPRIDLDSCIHCGKCTRICRYDKSDAADFPLAAYAGVGTCGELVENSASGGIFATVAESVIRAGGAVAGAVMDFDRSQAKVYHLLSDRPEDILRMQGSKYVQSEAWHSYPQVLRALQEGKKVLFSGTPCQVAALKALTGNPDHLVTVDLICHGVPPLKMFNEYLQMLTRGFRGEITGLRFRDKSCGKQYAARIDINHEKQTAPIYVKSNLLSLYKYFLNGSLCRENCYSCPYAQPRRISDLTIGDYWGIEQHHKADMDEGRMPRRGDWSCVLVNTEKGKNFLMEHQQNLLLYPTQWQWVAEHNHQLAEPAKRAKNRDALLKAYRKDGYAAVEAAFIRENGGKLRYFWRFLRNVRDNRRAVKDKYEN